MLAGDARRYERSKRRDRIWLMTLCSTGRGEVRNFRVSQAFWSSGVFYRHG